MVNTWYIIKAEPVPMWSRPDNKPTQSKYMKPNNQRNVPVREICKSMLVVLHNEPFLTLDVIQQKVAPGKNIYYHYKQLLAEGSVENEGHTKPLILRLTPAGCKRAEQIKARRQATGRTRDLQPLASAPRLEMLPPPPTMKTSEFKPTKLELLSRMHLEVAVLLEQIAKLERAA